VIDVFVPRVVGDEDPPAGLLGPTPLPPVDSWGEGLATAARRSLAPLVVFLHGGFWRTEWDRVHARPLARALARAGFAVATPEYRRGPRSWAEMSTDVATAVSSAARLVDQNMPGHIDAEAPVIVAGHSAGGQLALWAGGRAGPDAVLRIVALAPVTDLRFAAETGMGDDAAPELLGGSPSEVPDAYAAADVVEVLHGGVPVTIIQGEADAQVPVAMNRGIAQRLGSSPGWSFRYVELPGVDHFALIDPLSDAWPTVLRAVRAES
jgi:acetyl esterase/lipase